MNEQKQKHTPGPWTACGWRGLVVNAASGATIVACPGASLGANADEHEANARLIAEAGTVATETGRTPRQLADDRAALLEACQRVLRSLGWGESPDRLTLTEQGVILKAAIEKAGGAL